MFKFKYTKRFVQVILKIERFTHVDKYVRIKKISHVF